MKWNRLFILTIILMLATASSLGFAEKVKITDDRFVSYVVDIKKQDLKLYWKDDKQQNFKSILNLKTWLEKNNKKLAFAMNAGMYKEDNSPLGLFIENKKVILVDDVLYTGRTTRSALDAMLDYGRPSAVELLVLIDRRFTRQLPIQADYTGRTIDAIISDKVKVLWKERDGKDEVIIE